jgi:hypothetical protein
VRHVRVERGHDVQRLHHVGAVLAGQREERLEVQRPFQRAHLIEQFGIFLGRMAAHVQQRQDQRGELVPHRQAGEDRFRPAFVGADRERGLARVRAVEAGGHLVGLRGDLLDEAARFGRLGTVIQAGDQLDRAAQVAEIGFQLAGGGGIENRHGGSLQTDGCIAGIAGMPGGGNERREALGETLGSRSPELAEELPWNGNPWVSSGRRIIQGTPISGRKSR